MICLKYGSMRGAAFNESERKTERTQLGVRLTKWLWLHKAILFAHKLD